MANDYDNIIKENILNLLPALINKVLLLEVDEFMLVPFDVQTTLERKPDFLLKVTSALKAKEYMLQVEFQSSNDSVMADRMLEYLAFLRRKHNLPIQQYVIYFGEAPLQMKTIIQEENLYFEYKIISLDTFSYQTFLSSNRPEEIILSILCNFMDKDPSKVVNEILIKLKKLSHEGIRIEKYVQQLEVLSKLRNLQETTSNQANNMALTYDLSTDIRFKQGKEQGIEQGIEQSIYKMILKGFPLGQIAEIFDVSIEEIEQVAKHYKEE